MVSEEQIREWHETGGLLLRGLFQDSEVESLAQHFEAMRTSMAADAKKKPLRDEEYAIGDPLLEYPRILQPHHRDSVALDWLLDSRLNHCMTAFLGATPYAVQTMFYFKPPLSRGQALHQDQFYLRVKPGTCLAAWMAIDASDEENGCLRVVTGSHNWPILCTTEADLTTSFTDIAVELPRGTEAKPILMDPGDVYFFNGWLVHGSEPNHSPDRFRRTMIGHYIVGEAEEVFEWYNPIYTFDRKIVRLENAPAGGKCGAWVDGDGVPQLEMQPEVRINQI